MLFPAVMVLIVLIFDYEGREQVFELSVIDPEHI
jgi:hypothetical protein